MSDEIDDEDDYPKYESEILEWDNYPKFEEIESDGNSTLLVALVDDEASREEIVQLKEILEKKGFETKDLINKEGYEALKISIKNKEIAILFNLENCIAVRLSNYKESKKIKEIIKKERADNEEIREVFHIEETLSISKSKLKAIVRTGTVKNNDFWEPRSFWKFFNNDEYIGKAIVQFHASEMTDCAPTVIMFEVFEDFRRNGYGGQMIYGIEKYMFEHNFCKLRLENTKAIPFWRKNGYDIDIDEGEKYLDNLDYEY